MEKADYNQACLSYNDYIPSILPSVARIIVIGDIRGDLYTAVNAFRKASLIHVNIDALESDGHYLDEIEVSVLMDYILWTGGPTHVIQLGDQIDACHMNCDVPYNNKRDIDVLIFFDRMHYLAKQKGGAVISLLGDHEIDNVMGHFDKVSSNDLKPFYYYEDNNLYTGKFGRLETFQRGGPIAKRLACTRKTAIMIGSNLFVHSGLFPNILSHMKYDKTKTAQDKIVLINKLVRDWLLNQQSIDKKNKKLEKLLQPLLSDIGPFYSNNESCENMKQLKKMFSYKLDNIIVSHINNVKMDFEEVLFNDNEYKQMIPFLNDQKGRINLNEKEKQLERDYYQGVYKSCDSVYEVDIGVHYEDTGYRVENNIEQIKILEIINDDEFNIIK